MIQNLSVSLLIISLLACPLWCSGVASADGGQVPRCGCCTNCSDTPSLPGPDSSSGPLEPSPLGPADECQCSSCVCNGAVLTDTDSVHETLLASPHFADDVAESRSRLVAAWRVVRTHDPPVSWADAGRQRRLALQSLQI